MSNIFDDDESDLSSIPGLSGSDAKSAVDAGFGNLGEHEPTADALFSDDDPFEALDEPSAPQPTASRRAAPIRPFAEPARALPYDDQTDDFDQDSLSEILNDETVQRSKAGMQRFIFPAAVAAISLFALAMGYKMVAPMLFHGGQDEVSVASSIEPKQGVRPLPAPVQAIAQVRPTELSGQALTPPSPTAINSGTTVVAVPTPDVEPLVQRKVEVPSSLMAADMQQISSRVSALEKGLVDVDTKTVDPQDFQKLTETIDARDQENKKTIEGLKREVDDLKSALKAATTQIKRAATQSVVERKPAIVAAATNTPVVAAPPVKPSVLEGFTLKGASKDAAWVDTEAGIVKAAIGDEINGAGVVKSIRKASTGWVVVTSRGIIKSN